MASDDKIPHSIIIACTEETAGALSGVLQDGFAVSAELGRTVREFLEDECDIDPAYASRRITTIFLNSSPVDNRDAAVLTSGATLSLSGSMPGLMGIMMRSGSPYSAMRGSITFRENVQSGKDRGLVNLKLFNLVLRELGPLFLERGVLVRAGTLEEFITSAGPGILNTAEKITADDRPLAGGDLTHFLAGLGEGFISLRVSVTGRGNDKGEVKLP